MFHLQQRRDGSGGRANQNGRQCPDDPQSLIIAQTTSRHRCIAYATSILLILVCVMAYPFAAVEGPSQPILAAIFTILTIFAALMTAILLLGQFWGTQVSSIAVLGNVYLYASLINIPYLLTLPKVFTAHGFFDAGPYAPSWLWIFWQIGYASGLLIYVLLDKRPHLRLLSDAMTRRLHFILPIITFLLVVLLTAIAINPYHLLPNIVSDDPPPVFLPGVSLLILSLNGLMCICVLALLRKRNVLHLWLRVTVLASFLTTSFSLYTGGRYSVGWYVARVSGLMTALLVLGALLYEVHVIYLRLRQQNEELARHNRIQSDFLAVIGHEFRTALTGILGFSSLLREGDLDGLDPQEYASDIHNDATRLLQLINDLLDLERMKVGEAQMRWEQIEIRSIVDGALCYFGGAMEDGRFHVELDEQAFSIQADREKLVQAMKNLLDNALKYSSEGSPIRISSKRKSSMIELTVQDYGKGIPLEKQEQIFERYARAESSVSRYIGSTGLGLTLVQQIVAMHQGKIWVESIVGKGSTFHIILPIQSQARRSTPEMREHSQVRRDTFV
jgi:two-component system sensor histidine kinase/response regulator